MTLRTKNWLNDQRERPTGPPHEIRVGSTRVVRREQNRDAQTFLANRTLSVPNLTSPGKTRRHQKKDQEAYQSRYSSMGAHPDSFPDSSDQPSLELRPMHQPRPPTENRADLPPARTGFPYVERSGLPSVSGTRARFCPQFLYTVRTGSETAVSSLFSPAGNAPGSVYDMPGLRS